MEKGGRRGDFFTWFFHINSYGVFKRFQDQFRDCGKNTFFEIKKVNKSLRKWTFLFDFVYCLQFFIVTQRTNKGIFCAHLKHPSPPPLGLLPNYHLFCTLTCLMRLLCWNTTGCRYFKICYLMLFNIIFLENKIYFLKMACLPKY